MTTFAVVIKTDPGDKALDVNMMEALGVAAFDARFQTPVFTLGEILILSDEWGREVAGHGRKPSKWNVTVEHFDDLEDAIARAKEVLQ